jgi:DNA-methyltransferase (dcm)
MEGKYFVEEGKLDKNNLKQTSEYWNIKNLILKMRYSNFLNDEMAAISHFFHNRESSFGRCYENNIEKKVFDFNLSKYNILEDEQLGYSLFSDMSSIPFLPKQQIKFTFIDLFAGIGGFRMALQNLGGKCVFSSEWDLQAKKTYFLNYGEIPFGDITKESVKSMIPNNFDILCAGFPCQSFSLAGKRLGFDETRGTLFFDVAEIIKRKKPKAFFLENVKGLLIHDKGKTISTILKVLRDDLGYYVPEPEVINAMNFGVPQHRERVYIVGFRKDMSVNSFSYPKPIDSTKTFADVMEDKEVSSKYYLSTQYIKTLIEHKKRHEKKEMDLVMK